MAATAAVRQRNKGEEGRKKERKINSKLWVIKIIKLIYFIWYKNDIRFKFSIICLPFSSHFRSYCCLLPLLPYKIMRHNIEERNNFMLMNEGFTCLLDWFVGIFSLFYHHPSSSLIQNFHSVHFIFFHTHTLPPHTHSSSHYNFLLPAFRTQCFCLCLCVLL